MTNTNTTKLAQFDLAAAIERKCRAAGRHVSVVLVDEATGLVECQECGAEWHEASQVC